MADRRDTLLDQLKAKIADLPYNIGPVIEGDVYKSIALTLPRKMEGCPEDDWEDQFNLDITVTVGWVTVQLDYCGINWTWERRGPSHNLEEDDWGVILHIIEGISEGKNPTKLGMGE